MPVTTRSASRAAPGSAVATPTLVAQEPPKAKATKRKAAAPAAQSKTNARKKARSVVVDAPADDAKVASDKPSTRPIPLPSSTPPVFVPAKLTFDFEEAKRHLIAADSRFEGIFERMKCRPFEHLERVDPFRTLTHSILGQQISWLAARSITHKFIRLFDPTLPEKPIDHRPTDFFPSAHQVVAMDIPILRTAGLSQRKAEYVLDLAARFADGRLSTDKLVAADDDTLYEILTAVRGIGRWTVDMFAIFSLRRPDILPVGDLGVQRGVLRWTLSRYMPSYAITISPKKLPRPPTEELEMEEDKNASDTLPLPGSAETAANADDASAIPPAPVVPVTPVTNNGKAKANGKGRKKTVKADESDESEDEEGVLPTPFTPSINKVLKPESSALATLPPLPEGLTVTKMKNRLTMKDKVKGGKLTPDEMHVLTEAWRPYRSLGVFYMWALAEEAPTK